MLNFDKDRFLRIQSGAIALSRTIRPLIRDRLAR